MFLLMLWLYQIFNGFKMFRSRYQQVEVTLKISGVNFSAILKVLSEV